MYLLLYGGTFFAFPYVALSVGIVPSLVIGAAAFGAGELLLGNDKEENPLKKTNRSLYDTLVTAKTQNDQILAMIPKIDDREMQEEIREIHETASKIIGAIEVRPNKIKKVHNFFEYYLPVTVKMLKRYDEIENQGLVSDEGKVFALQSKKMIRDVNQSFRKQLAMIYQSELIDADAEMKVFESMLKADGYDDTDFNIK